MDLVSKCYFGIRDHDFRIKSDVRKFSFIKRTNYFQECLETRYVGGKKRSNVITRVK